MKKDEFDLCEQDISPGSVFLIEASAGTGKTFNIQHLYLRLILERGLEVGQILAVTFTEAATAELKERIRRNLEEASRMLETIEKNPEHEVAILSKIIQKSLKKEKSADLRRKLRRALVSFDEAAIFTIHGFCSRMLNENAFESKVAYNLELVENQNELLNEIVADFWRLNFYVKNNSIAAILAEQKLSPEKFADFAKAVASKPDLMLAHKLLDKIPGKTLSDELFKELFDSELDMLLKSVDEDLEKANESEAKRILAKIKDDRSKMPIWQILAELNAFKACSKKVVWVQNNDKLNEHLAECLEMPAAIVKIFLREYLLKELPARKNSKRLQSYDDMLLNMRDALRDGNGTLNPECELAKKLRNRYKAAMIDEFQDTDPVQCEIFETVFKHEQCVYVMIGDPKQSIYKFRNADIYAYLAAKAKLEDNSHIKTLTMNFRSRQEILDGVNELFNGKYPFHNRMIPYAKIKAGNDSNATKMSLRLPNNEKPFQLDWINAQISKTKITEDVCDWTAIRVGQALREFRWEGAKNRSVRPDDIAILVPQNRHALMLRKSLERQGIPAVISKSGNVFMSEMAKEIYYILRATLNPVKPDFLKAALLGPFFNIPEEIFRKTEDDNAKASISDSLLVSSTEKFKDMRQDWERRGVMPMLSTFAFSDNLANKFQGWEKIQTASKSETDALHSGVSATGIGNISASPRRNESDDSTERKIVDLRHLIELLHQAEKEKNLSPSALFNWLAQKIREAEDSSEQDSDAYSMRLETDKDAVKIMTIHKSKGLEFPVVFCPLLYEGEFDAKVQKDKDWLCHSENQLILPLGSKKKEFEQKQMEEELEELLRVAYVAVTRATHFCNLVFGGVKDNKSALRYLMAGDNERAEILNTDRLEPPSMPEAKEFIQIKTLKYSEENGINIESQSGEAETARTDRNQVSESRHHNLRHFKLSENFEVPKNRGVLSYSSIGKHNAGKDFIVPRQTLESGKNTGSCLHEIMQELDFTAVQGSSPSDWNENGEIRGLALAKMLKYNLLKGADPAKVAESEEYKKLYQAVCEIIHNSLTTSVGEIGPLNSIPTEKRLAELEFHYEIQNEIKKNQLYQIAREVAGANNSSPSFSESKLSTGFMKGFIDLFFEKNGKYYFVDWKSDTLPDYRRDFLDRLMFDEAYIYQHLIYSFAIHLYLKKRLSGYDVEKHFGGGVYVFLRGTNGRDESGFWRHRCDFSLMERLEKCIH